MWIGGGVILLFGVEIGDDVVVGVGSVVICDVFVGVIVVGNLVCVVVCLYGD